MITTAKIMAFLGGFFASYCVKCAVAHRQNKPSGMAIDNKLKHPAYLVIGIVIFLITVYFLSVHYQFDSTFSNNIFNNTKLSKALLLSILGCMAGIVYQNFENKMEKVWNEKQPSITVYPVHGIYILIEMVFLVLIGFGVYTAMVGIPSVKSPYLSVEFPQIDHRVKPPPYQIKSERFEVDMLSKYIEYLPCIYERDIAFYELNNETDATQEILDSRKLIYQLIFLLNHANDAQQQGLPKFMVAEILHPVTNAIQNIIDNKKDAIKQLQTSITQARKQLQPREGDEKRYPHQLLVNLLGNKDYSGWCKDLLEIAGISKINENDNSIVESKLSSFQINNMAHIHIISALFMWYEGDIHHAMINLHKLEDRHYILENATTYALLLAMGQADSRPESFLLDYSKKQLSKIEEKLKELEKIDANTKPYGNNKKDLLIASLTGRLDAAKNNVAYYLIRQQNIIAEDDPTQSKDERSDKDKEINKNDMTKALHYAKEVYDKNPKDSYYMDTYGYVRLLAALRGKYDQHKKNQEIDEAVKLITNAYTQARENYDKKAYEIDEPTAYSHLIIIEDHLKDAKRYAPEELDD